MLAARYRVEKRLGMGGMAVVYQVYDASTGRRLALKQLSIRADVEKQQKYNDLFEREYHTLVHLSHPRIIEVYDYGVDDTGQYYTMELLDGGDLWEISPVDWRKACQLVLDLCSALSLLHSRRMVHRDLSPRNVRCTTDGLAKLIDFGAMIPMGPCRQAVGTPPFTAPEVVNLQSLDGRTDLYSLGATLYYILTGRHAYNARDFSQLRDSWRTKPALPSGIVEGIPEALDSLIMSLINLDPEIRPASAAEVMERLSAIAKIDIDEQLLVTKAYLSTPTLVGREWPLARLRKQLIRALRGKGGSLLIQGNAGVGRSRFIDACILEGKLLGAVVVRADVGQSQTGDYGVMRALVEQLIEAMPERALLSVEPRTKVLGHVLPRLATHFNLVSLEPIDDPDEIRSRVQSELCEWLIELSQQRCLLIAVDDIHRIDEPSAAAIAYLSREIDRCAIVVVTSAESDAPATSPGALELLTEIGKRIALKELTVEETEKLLGSVFGSIPNLRLLAYRIQGIAQGIPRNIMYFAQHLVDKKVVTYQAGAWILPEKIDASDLPTSMTHALKAQVERLSKDAQQLAKIVAMAPDQNFTFKECLLLTEHATASRLVQTLDELLAAQVLDYHAHRYSITHQLWISALREMIDSQEARAFHRRLAEVFEKRGQSEFRLAQHLLHAGEVDRGLDILCDFSERSKEATHRDQQTYTRLIQSLPADFYQTYLEAIRLCKERNRPAFQLYSLQSRLSGLDWLSDVTDREYIVELIQQLREGSGLAFYHQLDSAMDPKARLARALELATESYNKKPADKRVLDPGLSMRQLARVIIETMASAVVSCDLSILEDFPSLEPLIPLSPALGVVERTVVGLGHRLAGRFEISCQVYRENLKRISEPDRAGLDENHYRFTRYGQMRSIANMESIMGIDSAHGFVKDIEKSPTFEVVAMEMLKLYYLWQGDAEKAEQYRSKKELLCIQNNPNELHKGSFLAQELAALALSDDLTGVKRLISTVEKMAVRFKPWVAVYHYAIGEYQRIRGDYQNALKELDEAVRITKPGRHHCWALIYGAYLRTLFALGRFRHTETLGKQAIESAESEQLGFMVHYLKMPVALAQAKLGDHQNAIKTADSALEHFERLGSSGINLGLAYETRARIAIYMSDYESYRRYAQACAVHLTTKGNSALAAKYEALEREAKDPKFGFDTISKLADSPSGNKTLVARLVSERLIGLTALHERARAILELIIEHSQTEGGFLYTLQKTGPVLSARSGDHQPPAEIETLVKNHLIVELDDTRDVTAMGDDEESYLEQITKWTGVSSDKYHPVLLGHYTKSGFAVTGLAVLLLDPTKGFKYPSELIDVVSRFLMNYGDIVTHIAVG